MSYLYLGWKQVLPTVKGGLLRMIHPPRTAASAHGASLRSSLKISDRQIDS
jgi:hypothetical protein